MRAILTRVNSASVTIDGEVVGKIGKGLMILLGVGPEDTEQTSRYLAEKILGLRIFEDENEKMNCSLADVGGEDEESQRRGLNIIVKESSRLTKMVEELLDSSRIQNGRFKLMVGPMNVVAEFEDTVFMMMERGRLENVTIEYEPGPDSV